MMQHFGNGGLIDYILREVHWLESFGYKEDLLIGESTTYDTWRHWTNTREKFNKTGLKILAGMRSA